LSALGVENVRVIAAASCYDGHLEVARETLGEGAFYTRDYRAVLDLKDVDAVIVATPDHLHTQAALDSIDAGKDVYCEKPLTHTIEEGELLLEAVQESGCIFQVGSQPTSHPANIEAKELIAGGMLGQITQTESTWDHHNPISAWVYPIPPDASPETIDWERFLGNAPKRPFDPVRFFRWRTFREYGESLAGDLLVHVLTTLHFILDLGVPTVAHGVAGNFVWKDGRTAYDTITATYEYPEGLISILGASQNSHYNGREIRIHGTKATMVLSLGGYTVYEAEDPPAWTYPTRVWPKRYREPFWEEKGVDLNRRQSGGEEKRVIRRYEPAEGPRQPYHMAHFVNAVRTRTKPVQDVVLGNAAATTAHLANLSYDNKKCVRFDRATRRVILT
jgi:predicted dehydrogenase